MPSGGVVRRSRSARLRRRRAWAGAAVALCLAADVWTVARADDEPVPPGAFAAMGSLGFVTGTAASAPTTASTDAAVGDGPGTAGRSGTASSSASSSASGTSATAAAAATAPTVVQRGSGTFTALDVPAVRGGPSAAQRTTGRVVRYAVEIEGGLGIDPGTLTSTVASVLTDPRGWQTQDGVRFVALSPAQAARGPVDLRITLASPDTTDRLCAPLLTRGQVSCHNLHRVVLNARRWQLGAAAYGSDVASYRIYLVNHEVGHGLGHGHVTCSGPGRAAPVMMQQTYGLGGCVAWPWPTAKPA